MKINSAELKTLEPIRTIAVSHVGEYSGIEGGIAAHNAVISPGFMCLGT